MTTLRLPCGDVRGHFEDSVYAFKGIPYAEPLSGAARWLPPVARKRWSEVRDAREYGPVCMQFTKKGPIIPGRRQQYVKACGSELAMNEGDDCLLLNVWTPAQDRNAKLPVMVWIHGGGFTAGAANELYDGAHFARSGVVFVAIQYRLGPPGFLHGSGLFNGEFCADNRALLDMVLALKWVRENIAPLGGDADNVTIFGESAGAFATYQLAASPQAKGLFCRVIAMGGMAGTCAPVEDYHAVTQDSLNDLGLAHGDQQALTALDKPALMRLQGSMIKRVYGNKDPQRYGTLGAMKVGAMGAATGTEFLPNIPLDVYRTGTPNNIDLMLGTCADDGQLFSLVMPLPGALSARLFMNLLRGLAPNGDLKSLLAYYKQHMPGAGVGRRYDQANNDLFYRMPTIAAAEAHAYGHPGRTYLYQLDFNSSIKGLRAIHAIDVAVVFGKNSPAKSLLPKNETSDIVSSQMLKAWTRFAATGNPQAPELPQWSPYDLKSRTTMVFDRNTRVEKDWGAELRQYWSNASPLST